MALRINWTEDEIEFVKENYKKITFFKIASRLNRSYGAVWGLVKSLGLNKNKREYRCWTEDEILFIKNTDNSIMGVAKKLNRSYLDVYTKARNLGLSESLKSNKKKAKKKKREEVIFLYKKGHTYKEIESIMRISNNALYRILREEGVELRNSEMKKKRDLALSLYEKGENTKDIIRKTNLSQTTIYDEARKKNVNRTKPGVVSRYNKETRDEACRLYLEGVGIVDILTILKIKYSAELYKFLRDEKIGLRTKINKKNSMNSEQKNPTGVENAPEQGEKTGEKTVKVTVEISRQANDLLNYYAKSIKINKGELADNILLDKLLTKSDDFLYCKKCNKPVLYLISFPIISGKGEIICKSCGEKNEFER